MGNKITICPSHPKKISIAIANADQYSITDSFRYLNNNKDNEVYLIIIGCDYGSLSIDFKALINKSFDKVILFTHIHKNNEILDLIREIKFRIQDIQCYSINDAMQISDILQYEKIYVNINVCISNNEEYSLYVDSINSMKKSSFIYKYNSYICLFFKYLNKSYEFNHLYLNCKFDKFNTSLIPQFISFKEIIHSTYIHSCNTPRNNTSNSFIYLSRFTEKYQIQIDLPMFFVTGVKNEVDIEILKDTLNHIKNKITLVFINISEHMNDSIYLNIDDHNIVNIINPYDVFLLQNISNGCFIVNITSCNISEMKTINSLLRLNRKIFAFKTFSNTSKIRYIFNKNLINNINMFDIGSDILFDQNNVSKYRIHARAHISQ